VVQNSPIVVTQNLMDWLGYKGRKEADKQDHFLRLLDSLKVPYKEIDYKHPLAIEYPCVQEEVNLIPKNNIDRKRWICMEPRAFKNVVMRLNTETSDMVREYYLNLEEAMFGYGRYTAQYMMEKQGQQLAIKDKSESKLKKQLAIKSAEVQQEKERAEQEKKLLQEELEDTKEHALLLQEMMIKDEPITRTQVIYIATTELYAKNNNFKSGGVDETNKLKSRLSTYNTGRVKDDLFYYSDIFMVSNYHIIEAQLKNLLGCFRDKKGKEIYRLHYTDIRYIVDYLCKRDGEDVEEVNSKLTQFIANLNKRNLRPIVPLPNTSYLTSVTRLKEDGTVDNVTIQSDSFEEAVKKYVKALDPNTTIISKKKVFDDLKVKKNRINKFPILQQLLNELRPEIKLKLK
jgi:gas vesicle protein